MRILAFLLFAGLTVFLVFLFNTSLLLPAPLGKLLSPQQGLWQNAEPLDKDYSENLSFPGLKGTSTVYFDERLVPHIFAGEEIDGYFIQGYLHAKFRLWQMDLQTRAAAGRASEVAGEKALAHDREFRRLGMVYAAENSLVEMEKDPVTKTICDAYTNGVNAFIETLTAGNLPLEYKLMGFHPEKWSNFKTALFLKYMSYDLASNEKDFELTNAKTFFSPDDFNKLYPVFQDSFAPIIPMDTGYPAPKVTLTIPPTADSLYFLKPVKAEDVLKADPDNGSNNWVLSGTRTKSGAPILCNDVHLGLNLPSLWYEMQLSVPNFNAYGATFPGAPGIIIGFNDSCAFGFTNAGRDVRDYYEIKFRDDTRKEYWFDNKWQTTEFRVERIKIAGEADFLDTVAYTIFGPVMFDKKYSGKRPGNERNLAVRWKAHDPSNEFRIFNMLNRARNYTDYSAAIGNLRTPGQNVAFASKGGDIAIYAQGEFPAKWKGQGDFIMPGQDSSYMWQAMIPQDETPFQYNPARGFVSSANQRPVDSTYPYYLGREYASARGFIINRMLAGMPQAGPADMMKMQTDNYNVFAEMALPVFIKNIQKQQLNETEIKYYNFLLQWNLRNDHNSPGATVFQLTWNHFKTAIFGDEFENAPKPSLLPFESTLMEAVLRDSAYKFIDDINTPATENILDITTSAFKAAVKKLREADAEGKLEWGKYKDTRVSHLSKLPAFSRLHLPIGGGTHIINATKEAHGPSWRMIVHLTPVTEAYGVYPGGQSGNPGSRFYDNFIDSWVSGKYYTLWMMAKDEESDPRIKWKISFSNAVVAN